MGSFSKITLHPTWELIRRKIANSNFSGYTSVCQKRNFAL